MYWPLDGLRFHRAPSGAFFFFVLWGVDNLWIRGVGLLANERENSVPLYI